MVQVRATVVSLGLTIAGDVASFGAAQQAALRASLRASTGCEEPACFLELRIQAGSIDVEGLLTIPHEASATGTGAAATIPTPTATIAAVQAAATTLVTSPPATISSALGVPVTSADPEVGTLADVVVPLAVAPPPPLLPPSPLPSNPSPLPPLLPPPPALSDSTRSPNPFDDDVDPLGHEAQSASVEGGDTSVEGGATSSGLRMALVRRRTRPASMPDAAKTMRGTALAARGGIAQ